MAEQRLVIRPHGMTMRNMYRRDRTSPEHVPLALDIYLSSTMFEEIDAERVVQCLLEGRFDIDVISRTRDATSGELSTTEHIRYLVAPPQNIRFQYTRGLASDG